MELPNGTVIEIDYRRDDKGWHLVASAQTDKGVIAGRLVVPANGQAGPVRFEPASDLGDGTTHDDLTARMDQDVEAGTMAVEVIGAPAPSPEQIADAYPEHSGGAIGTGTVPGVRRG